MKLPGPRPRGHCVLPIAPCCGSTSQRRNRDSQHPRQNASLSECTTRAPPPRRSLWDRPADSRAPCAAGSGLGRARPAGGPLALSLARTQRDCSVSIPYFNSEFTFFFHFFTSAIRTHLPSIKPHRAVWQPRVSLGDRESTGGFSGRESGQLASPSAARGCTSQGRQCPALPQESRATIVI